MKVYWLEQAEADLPKGGMGVPPLDSHGQDGCAKRPEWAWLGAKERVQLSAMRFAKRRADWQLGRWTAKHAVAACLHLPADLPNLAKIEVRSSPSGAPETFLGNNWASVTISLSHSAGRAVCAVATGRSALGCDLEVVEPHSDAFIADYFATEEQALVARAAPAVRPWLVTLLWSAKESALKALRVGLRLDTRCVIVTLLDAERIQSEEGEASVSEELIKNSVFDPPQPVAVHDWRPLRVHHLHDQTFFGWWLYTGNVLRTIVSAPPPARPCLLNVPLSSGGQSLVKGGNSNDDRQNSGA